MAGDAALRPGPDTAYVIDESGGGLVYLARVPEGPPFVLEGSAAVIWLEVVDGGTAAEITTRVAEAVGQPVATVAADVRAFLDRLLAQGLVVSA